MSKHPYTRGALAAVLLLGVLAWIWWPRAEAPVDPIPPPPSVKAVEVAAPPPVMAAQVAPTPTAAPQFVTVQGQLLELTSWAPIQTRATLTSTEGARASIVSQADGTFSAQLEPGVWQVVSAEGDFIPTGDRSTLFVPSSGEVRGARLRLERVEWIEGLVLDSDEVPLADARVDDVLTDGLGRFRVRAVREPMELVVSHRCCKPGHSWSKKGALVVLKLRRWPITPKGDVRGVVVDGAGQPCRALVGLVDAPPELKKQVVFPTAKNGTFTLPVFDLETRAYAIDADTRVESEILRVGEPVKFVLPCTRGQSVAVLSGRLVDEDGAPWTECSLGPDRRPQWLSSSDGHFAVSFPRGPLRTTARCVGSTGSKDLVVDLSGGDVSIGDVVVPRGALVLTGIVTSGATHAPIPNARINAGLHPFPVGLTDANGRFSVSVSRLPERLQVAANGYLFVDLTTKENPATIELTPSASTDGGVSEEYEGIGIGLSSRPVKGGGGFRITIVAPGGPASEAGLRVGDELLAIDDKPVFDLLPAVALYETIKGPSGTWVKLSLRRDGGDFDVRVQRKRVAR